MRVYWQCTMQSVVKHNTGSNYNLKEHREIIARVIDLEILIKFNRLKSMLKLLSSVLTTLNVLTLGRYVCMHCSTCEVYRVSQMCIVYHKSAVSWYTVHCYIHNVYDAFLFNWDIKGFWKQVKFRREQCDETFYKSLEKRSLDALRGHR